MESIPPSVLPGPARQIAEHLTRSRRLGAVRVADQVASDAERPGPWRAALVVQDLWMPPHPKKGLLRDVLGPLAITTDQP